MAEQQPDIGEDKTLLIVDDDEPFLRRLAKAMEKRGFEVETAGSVAAGKAIATARPPAYAVPGTTDRPARTHASARPVVTTGLAPGRAGAAFRGPGAKGGGAGGDRGRRRQHGEGEKRGCEGAHRGPPNTGSRSFQRRAVGRLFALEESGYGEKIPPLPGYAGVADEA